MRKMLTLMAMVMALTLSLVGAALADGDGSYEFPSTNELNRDSEVPDREGQDAPHVNFVEADVGSVTLEFVNNTNSRAFFEYRVDGAVRSEGPPHPIVTGSYVYPGVDVDGRDIDEPVVVEHTFDASEKVEIRLALGGERDWDFDWTTFEAEAAPTKDDCKNGGFADLNFRNQGQCIASIQANANAAPHN